MPCLLEMNKKRGVRRTKEVASFCVILCTAVREAPKRPAQALLPSNMNKSMCVCEAAAFQGLVEPVLTTL